VTPKKIVAASAFTPLALAAGAMSFLHLLPINCRNEVSGIGLFGLLKVRNDFI
jgi:hypothetical protein